LTVEHPYREPLWAQLVIAYYLADRQSEALDAYQRLKTTLADDLGIDPGPTLRALHERILRQEPLDVKRAARTTAVHTSVNIDLRTAVDASSALASLRASSGLVCPLLAAATRIGRLFDHLALHRYARQGRGPHRVRYLQQRAGSGVEQELGSSARRRAVSQHG
jgi:SARP family transcriptional regulator, regulator of embCAB operon